MGKTRWGSVLAAALVPTAALALVEPHVFRGGEPVRSADINGNFGALAAAVNALEEKVQALEGASSAAQVDALRASVSALDERVASVENSSSFELGARARLPASENRLSASRWWIVYNATSDGVLQTVPSGPAHTTLKSFVYVGEAFNLLAPDDCASTSCQRIGYAELGGTLTTLVRRGERFAVAADLSQAPQADVRLYWTPLSRGGTQPEILGAAGD